MSYREHNKGFTLIEIICVLAIVTVLATISFSLFKNVRDMADRGTALTQLRTIYTGILAYAADNDGFIPAIAKFDENGDLIVDDPQSTLPDGRLDLPYCLVAYVPNKIFLSPKNKKYPSFGYYDYNLGTSYLYRGGGQRLDGKTLEGGDFPLSALYLMSEVKNWHKGKAHHLLGNGQIVLE